MGVLRRWLRRLARRRAHDKTWRVVGTVDAADLVPERIPTLGAYLVADPEPKWLVMDCPCGRGHRLTLNLSPRRHPKWTVLAMVPLDMWPSVDSFTDGHRCHYWVRDGKVRWARDRGPQCD